MQKNRNYRSTVFMDYLNDKGRLLELYNALANTDFGPETELEIVTLDDVIWQDRVNDLAFTINDELIVLMEHQSTLNPNMPVRFLVYLAREYEKLMPARARYSSTAVKLPRPRFIMFYNGDKPMEDYVQMRLTDLLSGENSNLESGVELVVDAYNINYGHNRELMEQCECLREYSMFVEKVKEGQRAGKPLEIAMKDAVKWCNKHEMLTAFFAEREGELINVLLSEWDWDMAKQVWQEDARVEDRAEVIANLMRKLNQTFEEIATLVDVPEDQWNQYRKMVCEK